MEQIKWENEPTMAKIGHRTLIWFKFVKSSRNFEQLLKMI